MTINISNALILFGSLFLLMLGVFKLIKSWKQDKATLYFCKSMITANLVIIQVILIDMKVTRIYPWLLAFYLPFQHLSPVYFTGFTSYYLDKEIYYNTYKKLLYIPFILFFLMYIILKVNVATDFSILPKSIAQFIQYEVDENSAVIFCLILAILNFRIIRKHEYEMGKLSFTYVFKKTRWIRNIYAILVVLCIIWLLTIVLFFVREDIYGNAPYYPIWFMFLAFYLTFFLFGTKHLTTQQEAKLKGTQFSHFTYGYNDTVIDDIFSKSELELINENPSGFVDILSYFVSLKRDDKGSTSMMEEICKKTIQLIQLENCSLYWKNKKEKIVLKANYKKTSDEVQKINPYSSHDITALVEQVMTTKKYQKIVHANIHEDIQSILAFPIFKNHQVIGVLCSSHQKPSFFNEEQIMRFHVLTKLTGYTLIKAREKNALTTFTPNNSYFVQLESLMNHEKLFLNPDIGLETVAKRLKISSNYLSQMVNHLCGHNFSDYINTFRIEEAKIKLQDSSYFRYTILTIGLESGFNSKTTFYKAFKKIVGITPKQYQEKYSLEEAIKKE